jgi:hypothetical protein
LHGAFFLNHGMESALPGLSRFIKHNLGLVIERGRDLLARKLDARRRRHDDVVDPVYARGIHASLSRSFGLQSLDLGFARAFLGNDLKHGSGMRSFEVPLYELA